jgi:phosphatidylserine decarboxylase
MTPKVALQYLVPQKLLTRGMYALARWRFAPFKNAMIRTIARLYDVDLSEAENPDIRAYPHFDAFFTRALKPGARVPDPDPDAVLMPADGRISQAGRIRDGRIVQAKDRDYSVAELLGDTASAEAYRDGIFATVYLSPRDYHRVHTPLPGRVVRTLHVPGKLFSVAPFTVDEIQQLFARNERLVCHLECAHGPMVVAMVGAMLVSGVETVWGGVEIPPYAHAVVAKDYADRRVELARAGELGRFHMGSTVVVLLPRGFELAPGLDPGTAVRVGQRLAIRTKA